MSHESSWYDTVIERVGGGDPFQWFIAQLKPNSLMIATRNLNRQGFRTFCPLTLETRRFGPKFKSQQRPLFPGYVFVAIDTSLGQWRAVNSTLGVTRLVAVGGCPAVVPRGLVEQLLLQCDDQGLLLPPEELAPGDAVLITNGPFAGLRSEVENVDPDKRVWILLDIMGQKTRLQVSRDAITRQA